MSICIYSNFTRFVLGLFTGLSLGCTNLQKENPNAVTENYHLGCQILNQDFEVVRTLPGNPPCLPLPDGGWLAADGAKALKRHNPDGKILWTILGFYHHQLKLDSDGHILALGSEITIVQNRPIRFDTVERINLDGQLISKFSYKQNEKQLREIHIKIPHRMTIAPIPPSLISKERGDFELSHLNSITEVPSQYQKRYNGSKFLIYDRFIGSAMGLDENLQTVLWSQPFFLNEKRGAVLHDFQVLEDGSQLYFQNEEWITANHKTWRIKHIKNERVFFEFPNEPKDFVISYSRGSVELIRNEYLILVADLADGRPGFIARLSKDGKILKIKNLVAPEQEIKRIPYPDYLEKNLIR